MAESPISPTPILSKSNPRMKHFPILDRSGKDMFFEFTSSNQYAKAVKDGISSSREVSPGYKKYLLSLLNYTNNPGEVKINYMKYKDEIDEREVAKYFGEVLGPLYITKIRAGRIIFPLRANYELFDFFVEDNSHTHGFSSKAMGTPSNTLTPFLIIDNLAKTDSRRISSAKDKIVLEVLKILSSSSTLNGPLEVVKYLIKNNIAPNEVDSKMMKILKRFVQNDDLEAFYKYIDANTLHRLVSVPVSEKEKYIRRQKPYNAHNVTYSAIGYIERVGKEGKLDPTKLIQKALPQLNILKMGVNREGIPQFSLGSVFSSAQYNFRSKARWEKVNDKLGVQL